jgi:hypothetical protein
VRPPVLEPTNVIRRRRPRPLADFSELFRPEDEAVAGQEAEQEPVGGRGGVWEEVPFGPSGREAGFAGPDRDAGPGSGRVPGPAGTGAGTGTSVLASPVGDPLSEEETEELSPVPGGPLPAFSAGTGPRSWALRAGVVAAAAVAGLGVALVVATASGGWPSRAAEQTPSAPVVAPAATVTVTAAPQEQVSSGTDPDGVGVLREGNTGADVGDLQQRLLRIPNVYENGQVTGQFDTTLREAVARFQLWYGIRGDESGVYGDNTRRDLESRTSG